MYTLGASLHPVCLDAEQRKFASSDIYDQLLRNPTIQRLSPPSFRAIQLWRLPRAVPNMTSLARWAVLFESKDYFVLENRGWSGEFVFRSSFRIISVSFLVNISVFNSAGASTPMLLIAISESSK